MLHATQESVHKYIYLYAINTHTHVLYYSLATGTKRIRLVEMHLQLGGAGILQIVTAARDFKCKRAGLVMTRLSTQISNPKPQR